MSLDINEIVCHLCGGYLIANPLTKDGSSRSCKEHGDFFVQKMRDREPELYFRDFSGKVERIIADSPLRLMAQRTRSGCVIRCNQTGLIFASVRRAVEAMPAVRFGSLLRHLKGEISSVNGYTFTVVEHTTVEQLVSTKKSLRSESSRSGITESHVIRCKETGQIFASLREAATVFGFGRERISRQINGLTPTVDGYTFERVDV